MGDRNSTTAPRRLSAAEKRAKALEAKKAGYTFREIADNLGCSVSNAYKLVRKALDEINAKTEIDAQEMRDVEVARLDALQVTLWRRAVVNGELGAIDRLLSVMNRRARLLGLDLPQKHEVTGKDGGPIQTQDLPPIDLTQLSESALYEIEALLEQAQEQAARDEEGR
jgi:transposase-like protein